MRCTYVFAGIPVNDRDAAAAWYERLVGRPPDLVPNDDEVAWELARAGWIYVVADPIRAGKAIATFLVDDLDHLLTGLGERGIVAGPVEWINESTRFVTLADPDGNRLKIGETVARG